MMINLRRLSCTALVLIVPACGGGSTSSSPPTIEDFRAGISGIETSTDFESSLSQADLIFGIDELDFASVDLLADRSYTDLSRIPINANAKFSGYFAFGDPGEVRIAQVTDPRFQNIYGQMDATVRLDTGEISGDIFNVYFGDPNITGNLAFSGSFNRLANPRAGQFGITGVVQGTLPPEGGSADIIFNIGANLYGNNADLLSGVGVGFITFPGFAPIDQSAALSLDRVR